jgi:hypothetical protein
MMTVKGFIDCYQQGRTRFRRFVIPADSMVCLRLYRQEIHKGILCSWNIYLSGGSESMHVLAEAASLRADNYNQ